MNSPNYAGLVRHIKFLVDNDCRGPLAEIKKGVSAATRSYAWPHIAPYCNITNKDEEVVLSSIAAMLAIAGGKTFNVGNFGASMCNYIKTGGNQNPCDSRMQRFLRTRTSDELCQIIVPTIRMLLQKGEQINFTKLMEDIINWNDDVKRNWARAYYTYVGG